VLPLGTGPILQHYRWLRPDIWLPRPTGTQTHTFVYNATTQRLTSEQHPENGTTTYTYNNDGTLATKIDAKNQKIAYAYDAYQRIQTITRYPVSTSSPDPCQTAFFTWDQDPQIQGATVAYPFGRLTAVQWGWQADLVTPCTNGAFGELYAYNQNGTVWAKRLRYSTTSPGNVASGNLDGWFGYDTRGTITSIIYPNEWPTPVNTYYQYVYSLDTMARRTGLQYKQFTNVWTTVTNWVSNVNYGPANEMTNVTFGGYTETRTYNNLLQLTRQTATGTGLPTVDLEYVFSATNNNGQITKTWDHFSGEQVQYTYDSLARLSTAATVQAGGTQWGLSFTFDGFGNRLNQAVTAGSAPSATFNYSATNNRITTAGFGYDSNGNMNTIPSVTGVTYDIENRMLTAGGKTYRYTQSGQRIYMNSGTTQEMYYFSVDGRKLGTYQPAINFDFGTGEYYISFTTMNKNVYFNGRLIVSNNQVVVTDRLGSVRANGATGTRFNYYPYGEEYTTTTQSREKFATYFRDASGLDYANQRYYRSIHGGFLTPDPYRASGGPADPGSWNRYAYVGGDPVNFNDPAGLIKGLPGWIPDDVVLPGLIAGWVPMIGIAPMSNGGVVTYVAFQVGGARPSSVKQTVKLTGSLTDALREDLETAISNLSANCQKFFNRLKGGLNALTGSVDNLQFFDGRKETGDGKLKGSEVLSGATDKSLYGLGQGVGGVVLRNSSGISNGIVIGSLFNVLGSMQAVTLVHEAAHYAYQMTDRELGNAIDKLGFDPAKYGMHAQGDSQRFNAFLSKDCPGVK
jgi:RHS repeat-associated protein